MWSIRRRRNTVPSAPSWIACRTDRVQSVSFETRHALESTTKPMKRIAADCGFGTAETLHRVFQRTLHVTPGDYRARFQLRHQRFAARARRP
jgi:hypothetical protein